MVHGIGSVDSNLTEENVKAIIAAGTPPDLYRNRRVLVLTPDATRTCPLPLMVRAIRQVIGEQCARLDFMVALGTHTPLPEEELMALYGLSAGQRKEIFGRCQFFNYRWDQPATFARIGQLEKKEVADISGGLLKETVPIDTLKKLVITYATTFWLKWKNLKTFRGVYWPIPVMCGEPVLLKTALKNPA